MKRRPTPPPQKRPGILTELANETRLAAWWLYQHWFEAVLVIWLSTVFLSHLWWLVLLTAALLVWKHEPLLTILHKRLVKRAWAKAVIDSGAAPQRKSRPTITGPRAVKVTQAPVGDVLRVRLGRGGKMADLLSHQDALEVCMRCEIQIRPDVPANGMATVVLKRRDPFRNADPIPWPLRDAQQTSVHDPMPVGVTENGQPIELTWKAGSAGHTLICGITGSGKSVLAHMYIAHTALDPTARLILLDPNLVQFSRWATCAAAPVIGPDSKQALAVLQKVQKVMDQRFTQLLHGNQWKPSKGDPTYTVVIDELSSYFGNADAKTAGPLANVILDILQRGRAAGIRIIAIAQRPSAEILRTDVRAQFTNVIGLRVDRIETVRMIFGHADNPAHLIPSEGFEGVGFLGTETHADRRFRAYMLQQEEIAAIAERAAGARADHDLSQLLSPASPQHLPDESPEEPEPVESEVAVATAIEERQANDREAILRLLPVDPPGITRLELTQSLDVPDRQWWPVAKTLIDEGLIVRDGRGVKGDPYLYRRASDSPA